MPQNLRLELIQSLFLVNDGKSAAFVPQNYNGATDGRQTTGQTELPRPSPFPNGVYNARAIQVQAYLNIDSKNHQRRISISSFALVGGCDKSMWLRRIPSRDCMLVMESCSRVATWMIFAADIAFIGLYWCTLQWSFTAPKVH
jgi:hypothetical protein